MGLARLLRESRAVDISMFDRNTGAADEDGWWGSGDSGVYVDSEVALTLPIFLGCVLLRAEAVMSMTVDLWQWEQPGGARRGNRKIEVTTRPRWIDEPNTEQIWPEFIEALVMDMDIHGDAVVAVTRDRSARVVELIPLEWARTQVVRPFPGADLELWVDGQRFTGEWIQFAQHRRPGQTRGLNRIRYAADTLGVGVAAQRYAASWFGSGSIPPGVIEAPAVLDEQQIKQVRDTWVRVHGGRRRNQLPAVLTGGATYKPIGVDPETAALLATRQFNAAEVCAIMSTPPEFLGIGAQGSSLLYQNVQSAWDQFSKRATMSLRTVIERRLSRLLPPAVNMSFNSDVFTDPDPATRLSNVMSQISGGLITPNEGRGLENWGPHPDGDVLYAAGAASAKSVADGGQQPPAAEGVPGGDSAPPA